ncbi:MAG: hypothetical protein IT423_06525 [Pirellulaceae bacterium]|nr:hypothetical protein [Pirellulaceae bacterium]
MFTTFPFDMSSLYCLTAATSRPSAKSEREPIASPKTAVKSSHALADIFQSMIDQTYRRLVDRQAHREVVPAVYAQRESINKKFQLVAQEWSLMMDDQCLGQLRSVKIDSEKSNIINVWIFPNRPQCKPVFAAELIGVGETVRVAFIDIQTPVLAPVLDVAIAEEVATMTKLLAARFTNLPCDEPAPDWAIGASAGGFTYARAVPPQFLPQVSQCYLAYLDTYFNGFLFDSSLQYSYPSRYQPALETLHQYQLHHMEHSPGKKFLGNLFGASWTQQFMQEFLFAMPRG